MATIGAYGIAVDVPSGWEARIWKWPDDPDGGETRPTLHLASYPLPASDGDFGGTATSQMAPGQFFAALTEYGPASVLSPLFAQQGMRLPIDPVEMDASAMQAPQAGQIALQQFFTVGGRAFCLFVVAREPIDEGLRAQLNSLLSTMEIAPLAIPL